VVVSVDVLVDGIGNVNEIRISHEGGRGRGRADHDVDAVNDHVNVYAHDYVNAHAAVHP